jgi:hypothetical protein
MTTSIVNCSLCPTHRSMRCRQWSRRSLRPTQRREVSTPRTMSTTVISGGWKKRGLLKKYGENREESRVKKEKSRMDSAELSTVVLCESNQISESDGYRQMRLHPSYGSTFKFEFVGSVERSDTHRFTSRGNPQPISPSLQVFPRGSCAQRRR